MDFMVKNVHLTTWGLCFTLGMVSTVSTFAKTPVVTPVTEVTKPAGNSPENKRITLRCKDESLATVFQQIERLSGYYRFQFAYEDLSQYKAKASIHNKTVKEAVNELLDGLPLAYSVNKQYIRIYIAQKHNHIEGKVIDEDGEALPGVSIRLKNNKSVGTISATDGTFTLPINNNSNCHVILSYIGKETLERTLTMNRPNIIRMNKNVNSIDEVVVTGYQTFSKERITGSFGSISAKELKKVPSANVVQRLEGKVAGLKINITGDRNFDYVNTLKSANSSTRTVGSSEWSMNIRGQSTLKGESVPLLVVDGVITEMDLSNFNPNDIENITVLKDAAAASIWGVRAANGVIVITTKKGQNNSKPQVAFSATITGESRPDIYYPKTINAAQMLDYEQELVDKGIFTYQPATSYYTAQNYLPEGSRLALALKNGKITQDDFDKRWNALSAIDNRRQISKYLYQRGLSQQYDLSVNGGGNATRYYYSVSYSKERPTTARESASRLTMNLSQNWKLFNLITLDVNFKGTFFTYNQNGMAVTGSSSGHTLMPYEQLADENGAGISYDMLNPEWTGTLSSAFKDWRYNYLNELDMNDNKQTTNNISGNIQLTIPVPFIKGLNYSAIYAMEKSFVKARKYQSPESYYVRNILNYYTYPTASTNSLGITDGGMLNEINNEENNWTFRQQLNFNRTFDEIHSINAIAGMEMRQTDLTVSSQELIGYNPETGLTDAQINFSTTPTYSYVAGTSPDAYTTWIYGGYPTQTDRRRRFLSYYGNAGYTLLNRYSISGSIRYDDYNNFGLDRKYRATPLYSFGAKWNISKEAFMGDIKWLDNLNLRATYGINGNLSLDTYPFTKLHLTNDNVTGLPGAGVSALANPQLKWEKVYTANFGIDFSLLANRLNGSIEYYTKHSRDLLYDFPMGSAFVGTINNATITRNAASLNAHGWDITLNGKVYSDKDWNATIGVLFSYNTNKVLDNIFFKKDNYTNYYSYNPSAIGLVEGYPTDKLLVYRYAGLDKEGHSQIYDADGNIIPISTKTITDFNVLKNAGRKTPPYYGSVNVNLSWKQLSFYALATYQFGNVFLRPTVQSYITSQYRLAFDTSADIANRWKEPGDEQHTNVPGITSDYVGLFRYSQSDVNVEKGGYIRLRQISFSYNLAQKALAFIHASSAQLTFALNNIGLLWTANHAGYDPDYVNGLKPALAYSFGLNINF